MWGFFMPLWKLRKLIRKLRIEKQEAQKKNVEKRALMLWKTG
jgi:hypothetical protein